MTDDEYKTIKLRALGAHGLDATDAGTLFAEIDSLRELLTAARHDNLTYRSLLGKAECRAQVARQVATLRGYSTWPAGSSVVVQRIEVPADLWAKFVEAFGS